MSGEKAKSTSRPRLRLIKGGGEGEYRRPNRPSSSVFDTHIPVEIRLWHARESCDIPQPVEPIAIPALLLYSEGEVPVVSVEGSDGLVECEPADLRESGYDCIVVLEHPNEEQVELLQEASFWGYQIEPRVGGYAWREIW